METEILKLIVLEVRRLATSGKLSADDMVLLFTYNPDYLKMYSLLETSTNEEFNLLKMMIVTYQFMLNKSKSTQQLNSMIMQVKNMYEKEIQNTNN
ncbi:hypothetical protein [Novacetimonas hansenii]|uniref:Uncharacterized protein n=1 Tax=Novacetimonas hansenii TaxID=436 RepID=A0ABQ0SHB7_NOVHA|nr:hypothetical protein [Novacetimonas hansenii]GAN84050.1 hypothetical protein Gaha_0122_050 [Novacetimonas hansenii JCM 7643]GBQ55879.1 hypothetical protein AA0243_1038 [Novacetimonas hansenii NRIC 0243]GEC64575.1 hypothetical protein GHA01_24240 [Novacetimonas hansenii]